MNTAYLVGVQTRYSYMISLVAPATVQKVCTHYSSMVSYS